MDWLGALYDWMTPEDFLAAMARQLLVLFLSGIFLPIAAWIAWEMAGWLYPILRGLVFPLDEKFCGRDRNGNRYELGTIWRLYYWFFPKKLEEKRAKRRAERQAREDKLVSSLLLEYEKLSRRKKWLEKEVNEKADALQDFGWKIRSLKGRKATEERLNGQKGKGALDPFDTGKLPDYKGAEELADELDNISRRLHAIRQELRLHDIEKPEDKVV